jgi:ribonuclease HII
VASKNKKNNSPLYFERILWNKNIKYVAGVDEVGIGCLAGPVIASSVIFPKNVEPFNSKDSKRLTASTREKLCKHIEQKALAIGVGRVSVVKINKIGNIYQAGIEAMKKAVGSLRIKPQHLLVDARRIPDIDIPQNEFIQGEDLNFSIAAASIVAKVYRDNLMKKHSKKYPEYRFDKHKGYSTFYHIKMLRKYGPCEIHRTSYEFVKGITGEFSKYYFKLVESIKKAESKKHIFAIRNNLLKIKKEISDNEFKRLKKKIAQRETRL